MGRRRGATRVGPADPGLPDIRRGARRSPTAPAPRRPRPALSPWAWTRSASTAGPARSACLEALARLAGPGADLRPRRSCPTPACRSASRAASYTRPAPTTSPKSRRACSRRAPASWGGAAGPRPLTSLPCGPCWRRCRRAPARQRWGGPRPRLSDASPRPGRAPRLPSRPARTAQASRHRRPASPPPSPPVVSSCRVEIDPPRSVRIERTIEAARLLQAAGVDIVNVSDSAMARVRMGAMAVAFGIQHDLDLECVVHLTTRDRNLMALESELLGAHALGVRNVLALTGDPPRVGDYPTGTGVWDIDSDGPDRGPPAAQPGRGPGRLADRRTGRIHDRVRARTPPRPTRPPSGRAWSASSTPAPTWS